MSVKNCLFGTYSRLIDAKGGKCVVKSPAGNSKRKKDAWYQHQCRAVQFLALGIRVKGVLTPRVLAFSENELKETFQ